MTMRMLTLAAFAVALMAARPAPAPDVRDLIGRVHLAGCSILEHDPKVKHPCLRLRAELRAAVRRARVDALREAAGITRREPNQKAAAEAIERRVRE